MTACRVQYITFARYYSYILSDKMKIGIFTRFEDTGGIATFGGGIGRKRPKQQNYLLYRETLFPIASLYAKDSIPLTPTLSLKGEGDNTFRKKFVSG